MALTSGDPTYPQMILEVIEALDDKNGACKSAIWREIESAHPDLPATTDALLAHHLDQMTSSGQLVFHQNNYLIPDPDAPPPRGRGRPPKLKDPNAPPPPPPSGRPRGRPPKRKDPLAEASSPRPRGRPPKRKDISAPPTPPKATASSPSGRPWGRPPKKAKTEADAESAAPAPAPAPAGEQRGRGRPPKAKTPVSPAADGTRILRSGG